MRLFAVLCLIQSVSPSASTIPRPEGGMLSLPAPTETLIEAPRSPPPSRYHLCGKDYRLLDGNSPPLLLLFAFLRLFVYSAGSYWHKIRTEKQKRPGQIGARLSSFSQQPCFLSAFPLLSAGSQKCKDVLDFQLIFDPFFQFYYLSIHC